MSAAITDADLLGRAVRLAVENAEAGEFPFGALVVRDGEVVATGVNTSRSDGDPTAHAEVAAIRTACRTLGTLDLTGTTVVSSCEPCPMCQAVAALASVSRLVYAAPEQLALEAGFALPPTAAEMQAVWRESRSPELVEYVPTPGADEPFARFAAGRGNPRQDTFEEPDAAA